MSQPSVAWKPFTPRDDVASVRVRCLVPQQLMAGAGWRSEIFDPSSSESYDLVVFQKAYETADLDLAERLSSHGVRIVFDLCDNHFHNPDGLPELAERAGRLGRMIELADAVTVSSPRLVDLVEKDPVFLVDDALDPVIAPARARRPGRRARKGGARLVWFGHAGSDNPRFGLVDLGGIVPDLNRLHSHLPIDLTVVTNSKVAYRRHLAPAGFPTRYVPWKLRTFASVLAGADMTLLPITVNPFTICKTSNRIVTSLMLGAPVVADLIPSYEEFAPYVLVGNWEAQVARYTREPELRRHHVEEGGAFIRRRFAPEVIAEQWSRAFRAVLG